MNSVYEQALQLIENQFGITSEGAGQTFDDIVALLIPKVTYEMTYNLEHFFSLLYRLDISERSLMQVMNSEVDVPKKIATLILERQIQKIISRNQFPTEKPDDDLAW